MMQGRGSEGGIMAAAKRRSGKAKNPNTAEKGSRARRTPNPRHRAAALAVSAAFMPCLWWMQPGYAAGQTPSQPTNALPTGVKWVNNPDGSLGGTVSTPTATRMDLYQNKTSGVVDANCFCSQPGTLVTL